MTTKVKRETVFELQADQLLAVLTSGEFQVAQRKADEAVVDARFHEVSRTAERVVFEIRSTEYERGLTGLNKKKTFESVTRNEWDLKNRKARWSYSSPQTDRATIAGTNAIEAVGDRAKLTFEASVDIRIPLIGKKIEEKVASGLEKGREKYDRLVREFGKKA
jgi:hypothetical protein